MTKPRPISATREIARSRRFAFLPERHGCAFPTRSCTRRYPGNTCSSKPSICPSRRSTIPKARRSPSWSDCAGDACFGPIESSMPRARPAGRHSPGTQVPAMIRPRNDTFLRALRCEHTDYVPIWLMRQAGRYLPEYNATRARAGSFMQLCANPALATEVTLQPLARFPLDAAILFSDILTIPDAMGLGLSFAEGEGPRFERPLRDEREIRNLTVPDPDAHLRYALDAVSQIRRTLAGEIPLIGFSGSPFTLACFMIEGHSGSDFHETKRMLYQRPELLHHVLDVNARAVTAYLNAQIESGAQ